MDYFFVLSRLVLCPVGSVASSSGRSVSHCGASFCGACFLTCSVIPGYLHVCGSPYSFYCMWQSVFCLFLSPQVPVVRWGRGKTLQEGALPPPSKHAVLASRQKPAVQHKTKGRDRPAQMAWIRTLPDDTEKRQAVSQGWPRSPELTAPSGGALPACPRAGVPSVLIATAS